MYLVSFSSLEKAFVRGHRRTLNDGRVIEVQSYTTNTPQRAGGGRSDFALPKVRKILFMRGSTRQGGADTTGDLFAPRPAPVPQRPEHIGELTIGQLVARGARIADELVPGFETAWSRAELEDKETRQKLEAELGAVEKRRLEHFSEALKPLYERAQKRSAEIAATLPEGTPEDVLVEACNTDPECHSIRVAVDREMAVRQSLTQRAKDLARQQQEGAATVGLCTRLRKAMQQRVQERARVYLLSAADDVAVGKAKEHNGTKFGPLNATEKKDIRTAMKDYFTTLGIVPTGPGGLEHIGIVVDDAGQPFQRAHAGLATGTLNVGMHFGAGTIWHELGHFYEYHYPEACAAARNFLAARRTSTVSKPMVELMPNMPPAAFHPSELAFEDHFVHAYVGKDYGPNSVTEVISMGFERFATSSSMAALYRQDPEHFLFCLAVNHWLKDRRDV